MRAVVFLCDAIVKLGGEGHFCVEWIAVEEILWGGCSFLGNRRVLMFRFCIDFGQQ